MPDISTDGGFQYLEGLYALVSQSSDLEYWGTRFLTPKASLDAITLEFFTYDNLPIPLERMISYKGSCNELCNELYNELYNESYNESYNMCNRQNLKNYNPLIKSRREISFLFRVECYQYTQSGLELINQLDNILKLEDIKSDYN
jgi:hypothetical protein